MSNQFFNTLKGNGLFLFAEIVTKTCRFHVQGIDELQKVIKTGKPIIVTSWHGMTMMLLGLLRKNMDISSFAVIMPEDHRGEVLKVFANKLVVDPIPLNLEDDSTLGMSRKLIGLMRKISSGKNFLIHPDGPAGPAYIVKPGLSFIAKKTGAAILPIGCYCRHAYHVPRWDRYTLPLPFSKIHIQIGSVITVPKENQELSETNLVLANTLNRLAAQAAANYYEL